MINRGGWTAICQNFNEIILLWDMCDLISARIILSIRKNY